MTFQNKRKTRYYKNTSEPPYSVSNLQAEYESQTSDWILSFFFCFPSALKTEKDFRNSSVIWGTSKTHKY